MASRDDWFEQWIENDSIIDKDQSANCDNYQPFSHLEVRKTPAKQNKQKKEKKKQKAKNPDDSHLFKEWLDRNELLDKDKERDSEPINTPFNKKDLKGKDKPNKTEKFHSEGENLLEKWLNQNEVHDKDETLTNETVRMYPPDHIDAVKIDATIDLHKLTVAQAIRTVEQFIYHCYRRNDQVLRVIHGKGNHSKGPPKVKLAVLQWFRTSGKGHIKYYREASKKHGGAGATIVWLK